MITANHDEWVPTMLMGYAGDRLQQLWITPLGAQEWRDIPVRDPRGFPETVVGHVDQKEE